MLNKVVLMGRLVADPELRRTQTEKSVTSFRIAVDRKFARPGEQKETDFIDCVAWEKTAEFVSKWFTKGMQVVVSGRLQTRSWEDKQGQKRWNTEVVVDETYFADSKREEQRRIVNETPPFEMPVGGNEFSELDIDDGDLPF